MALRPETLPRDPDQLIEMLLASEGKNEALQATIRTLKEMIFGSRSEKLAVVVAEQLALSLGETEAAPPEPANDDLQNKAKTPTGERKKRKRNIGALPKHLPRHDVVIEPESLDCPCCAGKLHRIGEAVSEALDRIAPVVRVLRTIRPKYACRACEEVVVQAKAPARLIEGGMVTTAFVSHIVVAKYGWYSTLYRQMQILAGYGVDVDRQTLSRWLKEAARMLKSLYERQLAAMHLHAHLFCDETRMPVLDPGKGRAKTCQMWAHATDDRPWRGPAPPAVAYVFADGRGKKEIAAQLATFSGTLQVDGYGAYKALLKDERAAGAIQLAFCLTHARRKFVAVFKSTGSPFAQEVVERIAAIYAIEKAIRGLDADQRRAVRQAETKPLMTALKARLDETRDGLSIQSKLTEAINYTLNHWAGLILFLDDGRIEPDTNIVERSIRPIAIGRRNSLFCGDEGGGETWAILSSLITTAKLHEIDPETYLTDVLERIVSGRTKINQLDELLVWNWKAAREAEARKAAA